jgi:hypothetical protein
MEWQPIETAPRQTEIIVSDGIAIYVVGYLAKTNWYLGRFPSRWRTRLSFLPKWWLPKGCPTNPLRMPFPATETV